MRGLRGFTRWSDPSLAFAAMILVVAATERELAGSDGAITLACGIGPVEAAVSTAHAIIFEMNGRFTGITALRAMIGFPRHSS